ncbi:MAG: phosphotransferase family protein, partial [Phycisphaerae bacterium]
MWVCTPDRDRKLRGVRVVLDPDRLGERLTGTATALHLRWRGEDTGLRCRVAAYRATRRCVVRVSTVADGEIRRAYVKVFRRPVERSAVEAIARLAQSLEAGGRPTVVVPRILDVMAEEHAVSWAGVPSGAEALTSSREDTEAAACVLARLHGTALRPTQRHVALDDVSTADRWRRVVGWVSPDDGDRYGALVDRLADRMKGLGDDGLTPVHRDFYHAQLLRTGDRLWLVDFDTMALGHPEVDVATLAAHVILDRLAAGDAVASVLTCIGHLASAYRGAGGRLSSRRLGFYVPCALARLGAIHLPRPCPHEVVSALWALADGHMSGAWRV